MLEVTEQRPMNNEYGNSWIGKLSPVTLAGILKILQQIFINVVNKKSRINRHVFYSAHFSLEWQKQLCS